MTTPAQIEQLMMDALDGTLSASERKKLRAYLDAHPEERALFARMQGVDVLLRATPKQAPPPALKHSVMAALPHRRIEAATLRWTQIVFLIVFASLIGMLMVAGLVAVYGAIAPLISISAALSITAFLREVAAVGLSIIGAGLDICRVFFSHPMAWLAMLIALGIVALWARLVLVVWLPGLRLAKA